MTTRPLRMHRLDVLSWPTEDGKPFEDQPDEFWENVAHTYANPGAEIDGFEYPAWLPDIAQHLDNEDWEQQPVRGHYVRDAGLTVPRLARRHWIARHAAKAHADVFESWGCDVRIVTSDPITWPEAA